MDKVRTDDMSCRVCAAYDQITAEDFAAYSKGWFAAMRFYRPETVRLLEMLEHIEKYSQLAASIRETVNRGE